MKKFVVPTFFSQFTIVFFSLKRRATNFTSFFYLCHQHYGRSKAIWNSYLRNRTRILREWQWGFYHYIESRQFSLFYVPWQTSKNEYTRLSSQFDPKSVHEENHLSSVSGCRIFKFILEGCAKELSKSALNVLSEMPIFEPKGETVTKFSCEKVFYNATAWSPGTSHTETSIKEVVF